MKNSVVGFISIIVCLGVALGVGPAVPAAEEPAGDESALVAHLVEMSGISGGVCSVLGCDDAELALELARSGRFFVHVQDTSDSTLASARSMVDVEGLYGKSVVVDKGDLESLPYADNTIDLIIAADLTEPGLARTSMSEVMRVLRPGGRAILGSREGPEDALTSRRQLRRWLRSADVEESEVDKDDFGLWARVTKPPLEGVDEWTHWEHGPDNNPVSTDTVIKAPYRTQWLGLPLYIGMPAISTAAGGRIFVAMGHIAHHVREEPWLNTVLARNGYNGTELWSRRLPDGYLAHRSAFIATKDTFYMIDADGNGCLLLDPETGVEKGRIGIPEIRGEWKWMAMQDGTLFALAGEKKDPPETTIVRSTYTHWSWGELSKGYYQKRIPWGFGTTIFAYDLNRNELLWTHTEDAPVDSRAMVIGDGQIFFYGPDSHIGCLDTKSGDLAWTNDDPKVRELIEEPGRGLTSTPGFRTTCFCLYTPKALFYEAETRMNVVAVSKEDGSYLWHRHKTTNNPNPLYVDEHLLVGIGPEGSTLVLDPLTGKTIKDLGFKKRSCARLTATPDSFFCRGWPEGFTRYDRRSGKILFNGAFRPSCNDGIIGANGMLYAGPWLCDCNLSLMGTLGLCSSGDFEFEREAIEAERLEIGDEDISRVASFDISLNDWTTYRGNNARSSSSGATLSKDVSRIWEFRPQGSNKPTAPTAAGGLIFFCGDDGKVRAVDAATGVLKWCFLTAGPITQPPTIWNGRAYVGSGDGYVYALEAATGRLLWRFRAAPVERRIMVYGSLCSTWPVNSGVLVGGGVAYVGAGIVDYDGTYVYALDALTGEIKWQNNTSGHLDKELRKGISAQGDLAIANGRLWMPGGNVVSPASYDLRTGEYLGDPPGDGSPRANRGEEIGVFGQDYIILGGRLRYSAAENVVNPGTFIALRTESGKGTGAAMILNTGKIPPTWNSKRFVCVNGPYTTPVCTESGKVEEYLRRGDAKKRPETVWTASMPKGSDTVSLALARNAVLAVCETPRPRQLATRWIVSCLNSEDGSLMWRKDLSHQARPGGLLVDRDGRVVVVMENGNVACFGGVDAIGAYLEAVDDMAKDSIRGKEKAIDLLKEALQIVHNPDAHNLLVEGLEKLGVKPDDSAKKKDA